MWNRSELKSNAKLALKANYWKAVLVGLILSFILGSGSTAAQNSARSSTDGLTDIDPVMVFTVIGIILAKSICCHGDQHPAQYFYLESA